MATTATRSRIDAEFETKFILDDLVSRGFFKDVQSALTCAVSALQFQIADREAGNDQYYNEDNQKELTKLQLRASHA
jgi:hypothetical protein